VYVDHLSWPVAVTCYDGGIFVGVPPDILYCKDTKGDGKADVRKVVFTGFSRENVQGLMNSFQWSLDNRIQVATSSSGGMITCPSHPERPPVSISRRDFSFDPVTYEIVRESGGGQHGMSFDDWGRKFVCSNSDPIQLEMYEDRYVARNAFLAAPSARLLIAEDGTGGEVFRTSPVEPWRLVRTRLRVAGEAKGPIEGGGRASGYFSGATGTTIYRGDAWPAEYRGQAFVGDAGSNIVHRSVQEKKGVELIARRVDVKKEFVACNDIWFRPAQFANGPDGNLYCVDVYREVIEHPASLPPEIKKHLDLTSGRDRGRIYRILADGYVQRKPPNLGAATTAELVATLENPDGWHRDTASRLLFQRQDKSAIPALRKLAADSKSPLGRMHAMYALVGLKALTPEVVLAALSDSDAHVREHAVRLSEPFLEKSYPLRAKLVQMVDDDELMVRYQLAFSLGEFTGLDRNAALAKLAVRDGGDKWFRTAILSSLATGAGDVFGRLIAEESFRHNPATSGLLETLAQQIGAEHRDVEVIAAVKAVDAIPAADATLGQTIVRGLMQGLAKSGGAGDLVKPGSKADNILKQLLAAARKTATDENRPPAERADAVRSLSLGSFGETQELYTTLLDYRQPQDVQLAVLAALGSYADVSAAKIVIDAWPAMSPRLRLAATEAIFSRAAWLPALLTAVEEKKLAAVDIDTTRIKLLENHADSQIRERARKVFAGAKLGRRQDVVDAYRSVLELKGDAARGRLVFQKICSACHRQEGFGHELGPKLASLQNRGREFILINVLDPNREVNPQYLNYVVSTNNGRQLTGMVTAESATSITLTRGEGASDTVLRSEVDQLQSTGMSLMPEGLEKQLDKQGMADIIEYVMTVKN
jgi:putative membrane-bound dehydrogenase-like protein